MKLHTNWGIIWSEPSPKAVSIYRKLVIFFKACFLPIEFSKKQQNFPLNYFLFSFLHNFYFFGFDFFGFRCFGSFGVFQNAQFFFIKNFFHKWNNRYEKRSKSFMAEKICPFSQGIYLWKSKIINRGNTRSGTRYF